MSAPLLLVARRDFVERIRSRAFQISTGVALLLVVGFIAAPPLIARIVGVDTTARIGIVGEDPEPLLDAVEELAPPGSTVEGERFPDAAAARKAVEEDEVDLAVTDEAILIDADTPRGLVATVQAVLARTRLAERAAELGLDPADAASLVAATRVPVEEVTGDDEVGFARAGAAFAAAVVMFVAIVTYGQWILVGVVEEKANRVVELVLGAVRPHELLGGKILGIGALGILQLLLIAVAGVVTAEVAGAADVPAIIASLAGGVVVWFVLGFGLYAVLYAAAGSLVSRTEEAQNAAFPLTMLVMVPYIVAVASLTGDGDVARIVSLVPFWAPIAMPMRMAAGNVAPWEVGIALVGTVVTIAVAVRVAGRIYAANVLRTGSKTSLLRALRELRRSGRVADRG